MHSSTGRWLHLSTKQLKWLYCKQGNKKEEYRGILHKGMIIFDFICKAFPECVGKSIKYGQTPLASIMEGDNNSQDPKKPQTFPSPPNNSVCWRIPTLFFWQVIQYPFALRWDKAKAFDFVLKLNIFSILMTLSEVFNLMFWSGAH